MAVETRLAAREIEAEFGKYEAWLRSRPDWWPNRSRIYPNYKTTISAKRADFERQGAFLYLDKFLAPDECAQLVALTRAMQPGLNRNYLPGHNPARTALRPTRRRRSPRSRAPT